MLGGDLWSLLYEGLGGIEEDCGVPTSHAIFYSANVVDAIGYIHKKGLAYRDLKPENLMVDEMGYLKLVDLGLAKKIPFTVEVDGQTQLIPRSYTMCGTPEYMAPEIITNAGHDHSVDYWALGVLLFELINGHTPFSQGHSDDVTSILRSIMNVRQNGIQFPSNFQEKTRSTSSSASSTRRRTAMPRPRLPSGHARSSGASSR